MEETRTLQLLGKHAKGDYAVTLVDADTYEILENYQYRCYFNFKRMRQADGKKVGYVRCVLAKEGVRRSFALHRLVLGLPPLSTGMVVDHVNGNTLDNRRSNLRLRSFSHSAVNRISPEGRTQRRGVRLIEGRYVPIIKLGGLELSLGRYVNVDDAARTWDLMMMLLGDDSVIRHTNFKAERYIRRVEILRQMLANSGLLSDAPPEGGFSGPEGGVHPIGARK